MRVLYYWNKLLKKIRGVAILNSEIHHTSKVEAGSQIVNTKMSKYSFCGYDCKIINTEIGAYCSIADGVVIGGAQHPIKWASTSPVFYSGRDSVKKKFSEFSRPIDNKVYIGNDVWIGDRVLIKTGVCIGDGAVIGMGSVVTKNVGPYEIWAGNPAAFIRKRFSDDIIYEMLKKEWWNLSDEEVENTAYKIRSPKEFLDLL